MDQATLVGSHFGIDQSLQVVPDLRVGRKIVSILKDSQIEQIIAIFAFFPEYSDWRLVLSSPSLDQNHSLKAGIRVHEILHGKFDNLPLLMVLPTKDSLIRDLRKSLGNPRAGSSITRPVYMQLGGHTFGKRYVLDAFIISFPGLIG